MGRGEGGLNPFVCSKEILKNRERERGREREKERREKGGRERGGEIEGERESIQRDLLGTVPVLFPFFRILSIVFH